MNLFALTEKHDINAQWHFDSHVVKMPLEAAQLLCTARHELGSSGDISYKPTHKNHPCAKWVRESSANYIWTYNYGIALCNEYRYRYEREHACEKILNECMADKPKFSKVGMTQFALAMPDEFKRVGRPFLSYKLYYLSKKEKLRKWKSRSTPYWFNNEEFINASQRTTTV